MLMRNSRAVQNSRATKRSNLENIEITICALCDKVKPKQIYLKNADNLTKIKTQ